MNRKFAAPLPEFYKRRIVVWADEDAEFAERLTEITLNNAKIISLTHNNNFYVKKLLAVDDPVSNYLVYRPFGYESNDENWLLDVELYGEEFRADLISMWMDEISIWQTPAMRNCFKQYKKFFNAQSRRNKVKALNTIPSTPAQLQMSIMAALVGLKEAKPNTIIRAVLKAGLKNNELYQQFVNYGIDEAFWKMVEQGSGFKNTDNDIAKFAIHLILTACTRTMRVEFLKEFEKYISTAHQSYCYDLVSEWMHSDDKEAIYKILRFVEHNQKLHELFMKLQIVELVNTEVFPDVDEVILFKLMTEIGEQNTINVEEISQIVEKRRTCVWFDEFNYYYNGILQVAKMQTFKKEHSVGFHSVEPAKVWNEYTSEYYLMDTYYREFHKNYNKSLKNYHESLSDLFKLVNEKVEGLYVTWFLGQLGSNWSNICKDNLREYGKILEVEQQTDFYRNKVASSDSKIFVIISDAMRYEIATSLVEQLCREKRAKVNLKSMQAIFPTITKFGMAALLPHKAISVELKKGKSERLAVLVDGQSSEANNRDKVLKAADPASIVFKYKDIISMKSAERKTLVREKNVVFIYHDTIDQAGHSEKSIFSACDTAIDEIKNMVRIITDEWSGVNIILLLTMVFFILIAHSEKMTKLIRQQKVNRT